jgi:Transposase
MAERRIIGLDLGIASEHTVRVLTGDGRMVAKRKAVPTAESLTTLEQAALEGAPPGTVLEVVMEPTGPAWLPIAVFFDRRGHRVFRVPSAVAHDMRRVFSRHAKSNSIDAEALAGCDHLEWPHDDHEIRPHLRFGDDGVHLLDVGGKDSRVHGQAEQGGAVRADQTSGRDRGAVDPRAGSAIRRAPPNGPTGAGRGRADAAPLPDACRTGAGPLEADHRRLAGGGQERAEEAAPHGATGLPAPGRRARGTDLRNQRASLRRPGQGPPVDLVARCDDPSGPSPGLRGRSGLRPDRLLPERRVDRGMDV